MFRRDSMGTSCSLSSREGLFTNFEIQVFFLLLNTVKRRGHNRRIQNRVFHRDIFKRVCSSFILVRLFSSNCVIFSGYPKGSGSIVLFVISFR